MNAQNRGRVKLILVFLLFFVPVFIAYGLYYGMHGTMTGGVTNHGQLLSPVQTLPTLSLHGKDGVVPSSSVFTREWTILQVAGDGCSQTCKDTLGKTHQVWALLHRNRTRVQRVVLVDGKRPEFPRQPYLRVYSGDLSALSDIIAQHDAQGEGTVYLVDPHGNWVLFYPPGGDGEALFKDIRHLLHLSSIG